MHGWALEHAPNIDVKASTAKFKAHYRSVSGTAQFKTDWTEAWKAWLLGDQQRYDEKAGALTGSKKRLAEGYQFTQSFEAKAEHLPSDPFNNSPKEITR